MDQSTPLQKLTRCAEHYHSPQLVELIKHLQVLNEHALFSAFIQNIKDIHQLIDSESIPDFWREAWELVEAIVGSTLVDFEKSLLDYEAVDKKAHSFKESHWLYVAMCYPVPIRKEDGASPAKAFRIIQLCCLMEYLTHRRDDPDKLLSDKVFFNTCMLLRHLKNKSLLNLMLYFEQVIESEFGSVEGNQHNIFDVLEQLDAEFVVSEDDEVARTPKVAKSHRYKVSALKRLIGIAIGEENTRRKRSSGDYEYTPEPPQQELFKDEYVDLLSTVFSDVEGSPELAEYQIKDAGASGDIKSPRTILKLDSAPEIEHGYTDIRQVVYKQRGVINAIHKRNQRLIYDVRNLTRNDLAKLDKAFKSWFEKAQSDINDIDVSETEAWQFIWMMLSTGRSIEQINSDIIGAPKLLDARPIKLDPRYIVIDHITDFQKVNQALIERLEIVLIRQQENLRLKMGDYCFDRLKQALHIKRLKLKSLKKRASVAIYDLDAAEEQVKEIISSVNKNANASISIGKIIQWLPQQIRLASGDDEALVFLFLNQQAAQQPAQAHYTNYDWKISSLYKHITSELWIKENKPWHFNPDVQRKEGLGSEFVLKFSKLQLLATALSKRVEVQSSRTFQEICEKHNKLVDYIYWMLEFSIGLRSVNDPLASLGDIDWQTGLIQLNDKAMRAACSVRYVFLPNVVWQQLKIYRAHLSELARIQLLHKAINAKQLQRLLNEEDVDFGFLFYLSSNGTPERFKPAKLRRRMAESFPAPLNIGRHWLRSRLIENNCSTAWIDALLGHGELGTEFASRFSSLSYEHLLSLKEDYLEPLVHQAGWRAVHGLAEYGN